MLNKPAPSPTKEPDTEPVICWAFNEPVISTLPVILSEPVICCISNISSPNLFEPDEYITEDEIIFTISWSATIELSTYKFPWTLVFVFTTKFPSTKEAVAEPLAINVDAGKLNNSEPSPVNEPVKEPVNFAVTLSKSKLLTNPLLPWSSETTIAGFVNSEAEKLGTPKFGSAWDISKNWYLSDVTFFGFTTLTLPVNRLLIAMRYFPALL